MSRTATGAGPGGGGPPRPGTAGPVPGPARASAARALGACAATFWRLAWFTALRLLVNPFSVAAVALITLLTLLTMNQPFVHTVSDLHDYMMTSALVVTLGLFASVSFPAVREVRYGRAPVGPLGRTGRYLAVGAGAALVGWTYTVALLALVVWRSARPLAGLVDPLSHMMPFAAVLIGPAGAMVLVAWTRSHSPLLLVALAVPTYSLYSITAFDTAQNVEMVLTRVQSLALMAVDPFPIHSPGVSVLVRLYAAYLVLTVLGLLALALAGTRRGASRAVALGASLVLLAGAGGTAGYGSTAYAWRTPVPDRLLYGADNSSCRTREGITYCPMPGYEPWVDQWHGVLGPVLTALPESAADDIPLVWQDSARFNRDPGDLPASRVVVYDVRFTDEPWWRLDLLDGTARSLFGLAPPWVSACRADGQSRLLLAAWTAGLDTRADRADRLGRSGAFLGEYSPSQQDLKVLDALLELPEERVFAILQDHWEPLSSPRGRTEDLAELLDIPLRGSAHRSPTTADWDRLFPGSDLGYYATAPDGAACA
ncbi:hypothetical protein ACFWTE_23135 [Nocardiopsis sp. NPDC058631]|uniref:hypothetical protein n=1 Tax=Nocardiopsis sp. NPDC058631 TaxID=3346566 RepID=UPI00365BBE9F